MKTINKIFLSTCLIASLASFLSSYSFGQNSNVNLSFVNFAGDKPLQLDTVEYKNVIGQSITITKFRYYISNIHLKKTDGKEFISDEYFLVDEEEGDSKNLELKKVPGGNYSSISFTLGVDSLHNCSGVQSGALDPSKGMFWAWNTGYIFLKIEGRSPQSKSQGNFLEYHIGGFKQPSNCIRRITIPFSTELRIGETELTSIKIKADAMEIFKTPNQVDFSVLSSVTDFHNASLVADNYSDMFSLKEINSEPKAKQGK